MVFDTAVFDIQKKKTQQHMVSPKNIKGGGGGGGVLGTVRFPSHHVHAPETQQMSE